jgi:hemolysin activation/secretion protein
MTRTKSIPGGRRVSRSGFFRSTWALAGLFFFVGWIPGAVSSLNAADSAGLQTTADAGPNFSIQAYTVEGRALPSSGNLTRILSGHTGTNVSLAEVVQTAADLQLEYQRQGYPGMSVAMAPDRTTNGTVSMFVFQGAVPQILISGRRYFPSGPEAGAGPVSPMPGTVPSNAPPATTAATNTAPPATNATPHIAVAAYEVTGNDLLSDDVLQTVLSKYTGTNVTFDDIGNMLKELTLEYRSRGYDTVGVTIPSGQIISNGIIKVQVFEGTLASIRITGNHYYSSNNIMRSLPGLHTNMILNSKLFQPELDRANANQDRQISPEIEPGPDVDTTALKLVVQDRLPLHAKIELNNQNSPGTPDLRVNSSATYNNLWQLDHSLGVQYSFSPELYKQGPQWNFYDAPLVANYSGFYRMPLGNPESIADQVAAQPGSFGYDEATRKFNLPPPSGVPELNVYASRSTIDTGLEIPQPDVILQTTARIITKGTIQEDVTVNNGIGFRLTEPLPEFEGVQSAVSGGFDFKQYDLTSDKSFVYTFVEFLRHNPTSPPVPVTGTLLSPVAPTENRLEYMPLTLRWDGSRTDPYGRFDLGFGYSPNFSGGWFQDGKTRFQTIAGSTEADGYYQILTASLGRDQILYKDWRLAVRGDGQWANQPLISNEQFGDGGVAGVRGYAEGEVFGDTGWRVTSELKTPQHVIGDFGGSASARLSVRASAFMDYGETYLLDPEGRAGRVPLWGVGGGFALSLGVHWQTHFLIGDPLKNTPTTEIGHPRFNFSLTGQF